MVDGAGRIELDRQLLETLIELRPLVRTQAHASLEPPPRTVGLAMAAAIFAQPLLRVLERLQAASTTNLTWLAGAPSDAPVVFDSELLARQLGLRAIELDDLREDVDRRLASLLKQVRTVWWLWHQFGLSENDGDSRLFAELFPGVSDAHGHRGMLAFGPQLYALADATTAPPSEALYLRWLAVDPERALHPTRAFRAADVAPTLLQAIARGIGATPTEVQQLLERLVLVIPRDGAAAYMAQDTWRTRGLAQLSELGPARRTATLSRKLAPADIDVQALFSTADGRCAPVDPERSFDRLALARGNDMLAQLHAWLLTRTMQDGGPVPPSTTDLVLLDVESHLRAVIQPLFDWAASPETVAFTAERLVTSPGSARDALQALLQAWVHHFQSHWLGEPHDDQPRSIQATITAHLLAVQDSVQTLFALAPDARGPHRDILALFAGNYFARRPLETLLANARDPQSPSSDQNGDAIGVWFWNTWSNVVEAMDDVTLEV